MAIESSLARQTPRILSVFRILVGLLFFVHGMSKFFGVPPYTMGQVTFPNMIWFQGLIELVGGGMLAAGIYTRAVAFLLCGDMAVSYFMAHASRGFFPQANGGVAALLYCWAFMLLIFTGGGAWSLDRTVRKVEA